MVLSIYLDNSFEDLHIRVQDLDLSTRAELDVKVCKHSSKADLGTNVELLDVGRKEIQKSIWRAADVIIDGCSGTQVTLLQ
jgi:hypothetical protein